MMFHDRKEAGDVLAKKLLLYRGKDALIIGLPRGGVVPAFEISEYLSAPLDIIVSKKIPAPGNEELAIGAIASKDCAMLNESMIAEYGISKEYIVQKQKEILSKIMAKEHLLRAGRKSYPLKDSAVILVDDGIATGYTMKAAIAYAKRHGAKKIVVAVPVLPHELVSEMQSLCDELIFLDAPRLFGSVGAFYKDFRQVEDDEVKQLLEIARNRFNSHLARPSS